MASNEDFVPLLGALRLAPLSNSLSESESSSLPTPDSPLTTAQNTTITPPSSIHTTNLTHPESSTQILTQPLEDIPSSLPTSSSPLPEQSSSHYTQTSLITTLQPYRPHLHNKTSPHTTPSSSCPRPSTIPTSSSFLNNLFKPAKWDQYFIVPPTAPHSDNTLLFQQCLQKQVGKVFFCSPDRSRLISYI